MKTSELTGAALHWAVAEAYSLLQGTDNSFNKQWFASFRHTWTPHVKWAHGGPIIDREKISISFEHELEEPVCVARKYRPPQGEWVMEGPTPLIAAMRCFVASKLGDEVEIPKDAT